MYVFVCVCICKLVLAYKNMFYYGIYTYICIYKYVYFIFVLIYPPPTLTSPFWLSQSHRENPSEGRQSLLMTQADCWDSQGLLGISANCSAACLKENCFVLCWGYYCDVYPKVLTFTSSSPMLHCQNQKWWSPQGSTVCDMRA